ncbi:hypothetical protein F900_01533 [Acinetobacter modestus]|uniref:Dynamin N-terminal domain-containing protein n=1 Tax=Acinetobacter modestus TaxID=1776740 RepID=N9LZM8_9GAMM|nr:dynamin family protein [Acinetobacter modestus]ENX01773.1 hypothetical protein F900_01533 [Acinetobacter modestus]
MSLQQCCKIENTLNQSPLRKNQQLADLVGLTPQIQDISMRLSTIKADLNTTLRVFLIGEVKAGKSTLINAIVGQDLSPTNILEATAAIWEIGYAEQSSTTIVYKDGQEQVIEHSDIMSFFGTSDEQLEFAEKVAKIVVKTHQHQFKELLLIDSPGLATITNQNAEITQNIMQDVDLALWVFNANHLGQTDIMQRVAELAKLGKPIIAVINKIDETEDSPEKLTRYLRRNSDEFFQDIFAISAFDALNQKQDSEYLEYFDEFKNYLVEQVNEKAPQVKNDSIQSSLHALVRQEKSYHKSAIRKLEKLQQEQQDCAEDLRYEKNRLSDDIRIMIEQSCTELNYDTELNSQIHNNIDHQSSSSISNMIKTVGNNAPSALSKILSQEQTSQPNLKSLADITQYHLHTLNDKVQYRYQTVYTDIINSVTQQSQIRLAEFSQKENLYISHQLQSYTTTLQDIDAIETAKTAAAVSATGGVVASCYAATLGASAATVTMGAALAAIALPVTIIGAAGGLAYGIMKSKENKAKLEQQIQQTQYQIADQIKQQLLNSYSSRIEQDLRMVEQENQKTLFANFDQNQIKQYETDIETYISQLSLI